MIAFGRYVDETGEESEIWARRPDGRGVGRLTHADTTSLPRSPSFSADGRQLAYTALEGVYVRDMKSGRVRRVLACSLNVGCDEVQWFPDGRRLAVSMFDSRVTQPGTNDALRLVWIVRLDGRVLKRLAAGFVRIASMSVSPDGMQIALARDDVYLLSVSDGQTGNVTNWNIETSVQSVDFAPNGKSILFGRFLTKSKEDGFYLISPDGSGLRRIIDTSRTPSRGAGSRASFAPDGRSLIYTTTAGPPTYGESARIYDLRTKRSRHFADSTKWDSLFKPAWQPLPQP